MHTLTEGGVAESDERVSMDVRDKVKPLLSAEDVQWVLSYLAASIPLEISMPGRERISKKTRTIHYRITRLVHTIKVWRMLRRRAGHTFPRVSLKDKRLEGFDPIRSNLLDMSFSKKDMSLVSAEDREKSPRTDPVLNHLGEHQQFHSLNGNTLSFSIDPTGELLSYGLDRLNALMSLFFSGRCDVRALPHCFNPQGLMCVPALLSLFSICSTFTNQLHYCSCRVDFSQIFGYAQLENASFCFGDLIFNLIRTMVSDTKPIHLISDAVRLEIVLDRKGAMMSNQLMHITTPFLFRTRGDFGEFVTTCNYFLKCRSRQTRSVY